MPLKRCTTGEMSHSVLLCGLRDLFCDPLNLRGFFVTKYWNDERPRRPRVRDLTGGDIPGGDEIEPMPILHALWGECMHVKLLLEWEKARW